jgi:hypothetical protein
MVERSLLSEPGVVRTKYENILVLLLLISVSHGGSELSPDSLQMQPQHKDTVVKSIIAPYISQRKEQCSQDPIVEISFSQTPHNSWLEVHGTTGLVPQNH